MVDYNSRGVTCNCFVIRTHLQVVVGTGQAAVNGRAWTPVYVLPQVGHFVVVKHLVKRQRLRTDQVFPVTEKHVCI